MGEAAEMVLDGYLDWDGSYSGKASIGSHTRHNPAKYNKVFSLFRAWNIKQNKRWPIIYQWGQHLIKERNLSEKDKINFLNEAADNWKQFKKFVADLQKS